MKTNPYAREVTAYMINKKHVNIRTNKRLDSSGFSSLLFTFHNVVEELLSLIISCKYTGPDNLQAQINNLFLGQCCEEGPT